MRLTKRIVYTAHDGRVAVYQPSVKVLVWMRRGGVWNDQPRGFYEDQIRLMIENGTDPDHARRFAAAVQFGGLTEAEGWGLLLDRDCARFGKLHELQDVSDLPDRDYRDAWSRSANGGPIVVSIRKARRIQLGRIKHATERQNTSRLALGRRPIIPPWITLGRAIRHARDEDELKRVWPEGIR